MVFFIKHILAFLLLIQFSFGFSQVPNYEKTENWAVLPGLYPSGLREHHKDSSFFSKVDVFYVYPTVFLSKKDKRWNIPLNDTDQKRKIIDLAVNFQASAWVDAGRMFVPFYRQAHIRAYDHLDGLGRDALLLAYTDVKAAFEFYLENYNNGKPIILAGHSQGSTILNLLLKRQTCICGDIVDDLPLSQSTVSQHLKELKEAGLIKGNIDGASVCYCIDEKEWIKAQAQLNVLFEKIEVKSAKCCS